MVIDDPIICSQSTLVIIRFLETQSFARETEGVKQSFSNKQLLYGMTQPTGAIKAHTHRAHTRSNTHHSLVSQYI